jgi:hypothetical protein
MLPSVRRTQSTPKEPTQILAYFRIGVPLTHVAPPAAGSVGASSALFLFIYVAVTTRASLPSSQVTFLYHAGFRLALV